MITSRPVWARASRIAEPTASLPLAVNLTASAEGTISTIRFATTSPSPVS